MLRKLTLWQNDFMELRRKHKIAGSAFLFFAQLGIIYSLSQLIVHSFGITESFFENLANQMLISAVLTAVSYPNDK